jgi:hypothetical protein
MALIGLILATVSWLTGGAFAYRQMTLGGIAVLVLISALVLISPDWGPEAARPFLLLFGIASLPFFIAKAGGTKLPWAGKLVMLGFWVSLLFLFIPASAVEAVGRTGNTLYEAGLESFEFGGKSLAESLPKEEKPRFDPGDRTPGSKCFTHPLTGKVVEVRDTTANYDEKTGIKLEPCGGDDALVLEEQGSPTPGGTCQYCAKIGTSSSWCYSALIRDDGHEILAFIIDEGSGKTSEARCPISATKWGTWKEKEETGRCQLSRTPTGFVGKSVSDRRPGEAVIEITC